MWSGTWRAPGSPSANRPADKPLELDVILAAVVELADLTGTPAPTLRAVHAVADLPATKVGIGAP